MAPHTAAPFSYAYAVSMSVVPPNTKGGSDKLLLISGVADACQKTVVVLRREFRRQDHSPVGAMRRCARRALAQAHQRRTTSTCLPLTTLSEDECIIKKSVEAFCDTHVKGRVLLMDEAGQMPRELIAEMFRAGLMGIHTPARYGGSGMDFFSSIVAIEALARCDPSVAGMVDVQNTLCNHIALTHGSDYIREAYLARLAQSAVGSFCLTETQSGSDAFALRTRATRKDGGDFVINGSKIYITNAAEAELFLVMATVDPSKGYKGITCFVVDKTTMPGVRLGRRENKMGIRASSTCEVIFDNVVVPASNVVGEVGKGYKIAIEALNEGRIGVAALAVGSAQGAMDRCIPFLGQRTQFGTSLADFQGMQHQYAQSEVEIQAARLMVYNAARKKLAREPFVADAAAAKLFASQVATRVSSKCVELMGGAGFMKEYGVEKLYRDTISNLIYEGSSNIQLQTIAKQMSSRYQ
jgi:short-chain 2-methylacyl-CoA dehydrogenase